MRQINFRGIDTYTKEWIYGGGVLMVNDKCAMIHLRDGQLTVTIVIAESVGQFTGLLDKNEKEIYEDDICTLFTDTPTRIIFENGSFGYFDSGKMFISIAANYWFQIGSKGKSLHIEKLGNFFETPEILTQTTK